MAKPLHERITSARATDRVTITDLEALIAEITAERDRHAELVAQATEDSIRFELSEEDRDEAAKVAERAKRNSLAMSAALDELRGKLEAKKASEAQRSQKAERAAALAERDELAQRFRDEWPAMEARMVELLSAAKANEARMRSLQLYEPNAEAAARNCPSNFRDGVLILRPLAEIKLPSFANPSQLAWPIAAQRVTNLHIAEYAASLEASRTEQARWKRYVVSPPAHNRAPIPLMMRNGPGMVRDAPVIGRMTDEGVADARKRGCDVNPVAGNVSIGLPAAAPVI